MEQESSKPSRRREVPDPRNFVVAQIYNIELVLQRARVLDRGYFIPSQNHFPLPEGVHALRRVDGEVGGDAHGSGVVVAACAAASRAAARRYAAAGAGLSEAALDASGACGGGELRLLLALVRH